MEITNEQLKNIIGLLTALPTAVNGAKLAPATTTKLILMRMEAQRLNGDLDAKQDSILTTAKEGVEGFDEGIQAYLAAPDEHPDFKPIYDAVNEKYAPAWSEVLSEKVTLTRSFTEADILAFTEMFDRADVSEIDLPLRSPLYVKGSDKTNPSAYTWPVEHLLTVMAYNLMAND